MFVFFLNPCALANLHQQKRALKLCSATLSVGGGRDYSSVTEVTSKVLAEALLIEV